MVDRPILRTTGVTLPRTRDRTVVLAADVAARSLYVSALERLPEVRSVVGAPTRALPSTVDEVNPELVVLLLDERADGLRVLSQILAPELCQHHVLAVLHNCRADLVRVLSRLRVESYVITALSVEALQDKVRHWLSSSSGRGDSFHPRKRIEPAAPNAMNLVACEIRQAATPLSAAEVSARCGLSTVTCRTYLNQLVSRGDASVSVQHRPVGRPVNMYQWVG